jgi:hypothetical protein
MVRMGVSMNHEFDGGVTHLTGDGVGGGGGRLAGASRAWVSDNTGPGIFGGMRKCTFSSLSKPVKNGKSNSHGVEIDSHPDSKIADIRPRAPL